MCKVATIKKKAAEYSASLLVFIRGIMKFYITDECREWWCFDSEQGRFYLIRAEKYTEGGLIKNGYGVPCFTEMGAILSLIRTLSESAHFSDKNILSFIRHIVEFYVRH